MDISAGSEDVLHGCATNPQHPVQIGIHIYIFTSPRTYLRATSLLKNIASPEVEVDILWHCAHGVGLDSSPGYIDTLLYQLCGVSSVLLNVPSIFLVRRWLADVTIVDLIVGLFIIHKSPDNHFVHSASLKEEGGGLILKI